MVTITGITWMEVVAYLKKKNTYQVRLPSVDQMFFLYLVVSGTVYSTLEIDFSELNCWNGDGQINIYI